MRLKTLSKKLTSFILALALVLAGSGTAVGLSGILAPSITAKAASLNHSVTKGTVYKIGDRKFVAAETGNGKVLFIAQRSSTNSYAFQDFNSTSGYEITSPTTANPDVAFVATNLEAAGLTPALSTWSYYENGSYVNRQGYYGVPTKTQLESIFSSLGSLDYKIWTSTFANTDSYGTSYAYAFDTNGEISEANITWKSPHVNLAFYLDLSKNVHIYTPDGETIPIIEFAVSIDSVSFPDDNFRNWVLAQSYGADGVLTKSEIASITNIYVTGKNIANLKGIEYFTALGYLYCNNNQLTNLDVSGCTALKSLNCSGNQLSSLDLSNNTALTSLDCNSNQLTSLDLSNNTALTSLICNSNQLSSLDLLNNSALKSLNCYSNQLTSLDLSNNTALESLSCYSNQLTSLDVSGCTALYSLSCNNNQLTSLDVSGCMALYSLTCYNNNLTSLDLSNNKRLRTFGCNGNPLTDLKYSLAASNGGTVEITNGGYGTFTPTWETYLISKKLTLAPANNGVTDTHVFTNWTAEGTGVDHLSMNNNGQTATVTFNNTEDWTDKSVKISGNWGERIYVLTVKEVYQNENGEAERTETATENHSYNDSVTKTATVPDGYSIVGDSSKTVTMDDNKEITFTYRKNAPTEYTLTVNEIYQDENGAEERTVTNTETITAGETVTRTKTAPKGYTIVGDSSATVTMDDNKEITFTYKKNTYDITYDLAGGELPFGVTNPSTYTVESDAFTLNNPVDRIGYTFDGWTGSNGTTAQTTVTVAQGTTGNLNYTANWTLKSWYEDPDGDGIATLKPGYNANGTLIDYMITYNLDGGTATAINPTTYTVETDDINLSVATKAGYTFNGWTGSNGDVAQRSVTIPKGTTGNLTYTANWTLMGGYNTDGTLINYDITYDLGGGELPSGVINPSAYTVESDAFTLNNPVDRIGYTFDGWTGSNGTTAQTTVTVTQGTTGNLNYTANWTLKSWYEDPDGDGVATLKAGYNEDGSLISYTITYDLAGGSLPTGVTNPATYSVESDTFTLNNPSDRTGYTFNGWTGSNGTTPQTTVSVSKGSTENKTYTANWTLKSWYEDPDGDGIATLKPGYNADGTLINYTLTINEVYKKYDGSEERTTTRTENITAGETVTRTATVPTGYAIVGESSQTVTMDDNKTITFTFKRTSKTGYTLFLSPLKLRWQGLSGAPAVKRVGNITLTYGSKNVGRFAGSALIAIDPTDLPDGKRIKVSVPSTTTVTIGGVELTASVTDFDEAILDNTASRQFRVNLVTDRDDLPFEDFVGKPVVGNIKVTVEEV